MCSHPQWTEMNKKSFFNKIPQFGKILSYVMIQNISWESITCFKKLNIQDKWWNYFKLQESDKILTKSSTTNVSDTVIERAECSFFV